MGQLFRPLRYLNILYYEATLQRFFAQWIVSDSLVSKDLNFSTRHFEVKMTISQFGQPLIERGQFSSILQWKNNFQLKI